MNQLLFCIHSTPALPSILNCPWRRWPRLPAQQHLQILAAIPTIIADLNKTTVNYIGLEKPPVVSTDLHVLR